MREGFPLQWPANIKRTAKVVRAKFKTAAIDRPRRGILNEIKLLKGKNAVITSNIPLRADGQLFATGKPSGGEMAIAVYFDWQSVDYVVACDNYDRIEDNLRAAEKIIEALRGIERWGNKGIVEQAFEGFKLKALPPPVNRTVQKTGPAPGTAWWDTLCVSENTDRAVLDAAYKALVKKYHPDNQVTGNNAKFIQIQAAYEQAKKEVI